MVQFTILGPVRAYPDGGKGDLLQPLQPLHKLFLAVLLAAEGRPVPVSRLIEQMWGPYPPADPRGRLYTCASRTRIALRDAGADDTELLQMADGCYRLRVLPEQIDAYRFRRLAAEARSLARHDDTEAGRLSLAALAEWGPRGSDLYGPEPLAGLPGDWAENYRNTLQREHRDLLIGYLESELRRGRHEPLVPELAALADADDASRTDEQLAALLMRACYLSNRQAQALQAYRRLQESLKRKGLEPGKELRMLEERIRDQDPALDLPHAFPVAVTESPDGAKHGTDDAQDDPQPRRPGPNTDAVSAESAPPNGRDAAGSAIIYTQQNNGNTVHASQGGTQNYYYGEKS
jgi:DNA-binding SARP family transcriptional activator